MRVRRRGVPVSAHCIQHVGFPCPPWCITPGAGVAGPRPAVVDYGPNPDREPVAVGDTFHRVGDPGGAWEVTERWDHEWRLDRGSDFTLQSTAALLDRARWVPARAI